MTRREIEAQRWKRQRVRSWWRTPAERSDSLPREIARMDPRYRLLRCLARTSKEMWASFFACRRGRG